MSGEVKVVSFFTAILVVLVVVNATQTTAVEVKSTELVLKTEVRQVNTAEDIESIRTGLVKPILYSQVKGLAELPPFEEKARFVDIILPAILVAKYNIEESRQRLKAITDSDSWTFEDSVFLRKLSKKYRTDDYEQLSLRLITHPNSIVLAQAAVESGWGKSRFFKEANNLFGIWSYSSKEPRIKAGISRPGHQVYLRKYGNISESIVDYFQTIGRASAYSAFRKERVKTGDIDKLLPLLSAYSERKEEYVKQLRTMIKFNEFEQYDSYSIDPSYIVTNYVKE